MEPIASSDQQAWNNASRADMAGRWHVWCADCGSKNHKNASECSRCGYGDGQGTFGVGNRRNVGRPKYTSDGERGRHPREADDD